MSGIEGQLYFDLLLFTADEPRLRAVSDSHNAAITSQQSPK